MEKKETIYCGNGKEVNFQDGGSIVNFTLHLDKIKEHVMIMRVKNMLTSQSLL